MENQDYIYLDHAATTAVHPRVLEAMLPFFSERYGNPSSVYSLARGSRQAADRARETVAEAIGARPNEIIFTSGGSESDNLAIKGVAFARQAKGNHLITTRIEHHAVLHTFEYLEKRFGFRVTYLPVDEHGVVDLEALARAVDGETTLVTIMAANNEVGTLQPIEEIGKFLKGKDIVFHTDAVQAMGSVPVNVDTWGVDMLSMSAHKFYGPKGMGVLYVRRGTNFWPQQQGGSQERGRRAGTENVAGMVGLATALGLAYEQLETNNAHVSAMRDILVKGVLGGVPDVRFTGHPTCRLPNNASFVFKYVEGESILLNLDMLGIAASSGSACTSASLEPSHVLTAMGIPVELAHGSLRLTTGTDNTAEQMRRVVSALPAILQKLRAISPLTTAS
ncbi:MAG: cysteine desulfurase NifS [Chloroflexota bacterium]